MTDRILVRPAEAGQLIGLCEAKIYALIAAGHIPIVSIPDTRGIFIRVESLHALAGSWEIPANGAQRVAERRKSTNPTRRHSLPPENRRGAAVVGGGSDLETA